MKTLIAVRYVNRAGANHDWGRVLILRDRLANCQQRANVTAGPCTTSKTVSRFPNLLVKTAPFKAGCLMRPSRTAPFTPTGRGLGGADCTAHASTSVRVDPRPEPPRGDQPRLAGRPPAQQPRLHCPASSLKRRIPPRYPAHTLPANVPRGAPFTHVFTTTLGCSGRQRAEKPQGHWV
jgi:hypothetical protein